MIEITLKLWLSVGIALTLSLLVNALLVIDHLIKKYPGVYDFFFEDKEVEIEIEEAEESIIKNNVFKTIKGVETYVK